MLPVIITFLRAYAPYITLPVAAVIGFVGYNFENIVSDKYTPYKGSIKEERVDRFLSESGNKDETQVDSLKSKSFVPKTVFEKNVSPSLAGGK